MNRGIIDKLGKAIKETGKTVVDTGKGIKQEMDARAEIERKKRVLLGGFTMSDLKKICNEYGIGEPSSYETNLFSERTKIKLTRDDYSNYIVKRLDLKNIKDFCNKTRIRIESEPIYMQPPEQNPKIQAQPPEQNEFHEILHKIKEQFKPEPCINEKELQGQLKIWLDVMYSNRATREIPTMAGRVRKDTVPR